MTTVKSGFMSSEFWGMLFSQAPAIVALVLGASNPITLGISAACVLGSSIYSHKRTLLKSKGLDVAVAVASAAAEKIAALPKDE